MALAQRPRIGLKNVVYAILNESTDVIGGTPTWGTPQPLANAIEMSFDPASSATTLFADDGPAFTAETVGEMMINFSVADLLPQAEADLFGYGYSNGLTVQNSGNQSPYIALGAKVARAGKDGGSEVYDYIWLYKVKLNKPNAADRTKEASIEFKVPTVEGRVVQLTSSGDYRIKARSDDTNVIPATLTNWFNQPVLASSDVTPLTATIAEGAGGDAGKVVVTFVKGSGASFSLIASTVASPNVVVTSSAGGVRAGTWAVSGAGTSVTAKFTPSVAFGAGEDVGVVVTPGVKDASSVAATTTGDVLTF